MFKTIQGTLAAVVANNGTFTVGYPTGFSKGNFDNAPGNHKLMLGSNAYSAPEDFTLTFNANASGITVTNKSGSSWPADTAFILQAERSGASPENALPADKVRMIAAGVYLLDLGSPVTADADGIANDFALGATADTGDSGDFVAAFSGALDVPRNLVLTGSSGSDQVITVSGTRAGVAVSETFTLSGTTPQVGDKAFDTVTGWAVAAGGAASKTVDIGWGEKLGLPSALVSASHVLAEFKNGVLLPRKPAKVFLPYEIEQVELLAATSEELVSPVAGAIVRLRGVAQGAVTTGGDVTVEVNTVAVDGLTITLANSDAKGTRYADTPTADHATAVVAVGDRIEIQPNAAIDTAGQLNGILEIDVSVAGQLDGTVVVADPLEATATTGDSRGTYTPSTVADGSTGHRLLVALPDPAFVGVTQYAA